MEIENILKEAAWCLGCKNKPCSNACPMHTNIPEFISKIKEENYEDAYNILIDNNVFSYVCSLVCPQEEQCQGSCVRGIKTEPTKIGVLESFVNKWAKENNVEAKISQEEIKENVKVAIIGAGPAGLSCAYELAKKGILATVYEKENYIGGILTYGIPDFRLNKDIIENIGDTLIRLGVKFEFNSELGKNITLDKLKKENDFVFIGIGAELSSIYKLAEEKNDNIYDSDAFLRAYNNKKFLKDLGHVVVIGGGNVAMDSARAAVRMGATKVSILYRRDRAHMPARDVELDEAIADGVDFRELVRVDSANIENGKIKSVHCNKTEIIDGKAVDIDGDVFDYQANTVVFAIGLKPNRKLLENEGLKLTEWGTIEVDDNNQTNIENVFAGGDVVDNKSVVCKALASGKKAAETIISKV